MKKEIEGEFEKEFKKDIIAAMKDVRREIKESYVSIAYMKEAIIFLTYNNEVIVLSNNKMRNNLIKMTNHLFWYTVAYSLVIGTLKCLIL